MSERSRIALLAARLGRVAPGVSVGIGDDAAVLEPDLVWTVDAHVDGTHFRPTWASWEEIGARSFMAAASDLAAMGAEPVAALSSLVLTSSIDDEAFEALVCGQAAAASAVGAPIVGGNLARGTETSITTTLLGRAAHPVLRTGAQQGDGVWLAGAVGLAAAGLALLIEGRSSDRNAAVAACVEAWRKPVARIREGRELAGVAHAAIDISDGLAHDAEQLAESSGVRIVFDAAALRARLSADLVAVAALLGRDAFDLALDGGEDYAILAASAEPLPSFVRIGSVQRFDGGARVCLATERGLEPRVPRGFDHFR